MLPPTPDIKKACGLLEEFIHQILNARKSSSGSGEYEANVEAENLMYLIIRNIEAVITLAREDLVLLPSAMILTRSVFEMAMKTLWMLAPQDVFNREVRWLAQLQTEEEYYDRVSRQLHKLGLDNSKAVRMRDEVSAFRIAVTNVLPPPYTPISKVPNLAELMKDINEGSKYSFYTFLCQYSHGSHVATSIYRRGLGTKKEFGEYIAAKDWGLVFSMCWYSLAKTSERIFEIAGIDVNQFLKDEFVAEIQETIKRIETAET
ncbi:MAG: DUF5677 domain-containing protein [Anaerolineales bacterium]